MGDNNLKHEEFTHTQSFIPSQNEKLGGRSVLRNPAAALSFWKRKTLNVDDKIIIKSNPFQNIANDRPMKTYSLLKVIGLMSVGVFLFSGIAMMHYSSLATHSIMQASDETLEAAMATNPDMLARALNAMKIGE